MSEMTKQDIIKAMEDLPEDADIEDAMERLYVIYRIEKGLKQAEAGEVVSHDEARARMSKWLQ